MPSVTFLWNKKLICFFFFYLQLQSLFPFFSSGVLVNGHLYVNMKNRDQVLIDGLLENHVGLAFVWERREILPWLSFNLLISRLSTSLCMVFGRCCISLKMKSWREESYCVEEKKKYIYLLVLFLTNGYLVEETQTWSTHWGDGRDSSDRGPAGLLNPGLLSTAQSVRRRCDGKQKDLWLRWLGWL